MIVMSGNILIIDDEEPLRKLVGRIIGLEGFRVYEAGTLRAGFDTLTREEIDVVLCDVKLPDGNGVDFVKHAKTKFPLVEIILLTAYGNIADGVQAIKNGAFDYIIKGNDNDRIVPLLYQATDKVKHQRKSAVKIKEKDTHSFDDIIGHSSVIQQAISLAKKIAPTNTNVLLLGETGTGKEIFANAIHTNSNRSGKPFIAINCSAFTKELLEGELFGHKAGAYTGATKDKKGLIELVDNGTLFLDEIGEMNIDLQAKLLRVIENGEFFKLGDVKKTKVNVRIIAATNRELPKSVEKGEFREDLYYRLNVFTILLPPLRDRTEDISDLVDHFLSIYALRENKRLTINSDALRLLQQHHWKGNIRELRNVLERSAILVENAEITPGDLPYEIQKQGRAASDSLTLASIEKKHIQKILQYTGGNKTKAAGVLGIGLTTLYRKLEEYHISK
jgi:DNA-binding NtrC family response regulator